MSTRGNAPGKQNTNITVIGIISAGLVVIGLVALLASATGGGGSRKSRSQGKAQYTPQEYVQMAAEQERMQNWLKAKNYWQLAAESWEEMGQSAEAIQCNQRANDIGKSMRLPDFK